VSHEKLWAPWRLAYIATAKEQEAEGCFLCQYRDGSDDAESLVVLRTEHALTVLNRYPYNNGHLLVAPREHKAALEDLNDDELLDCMHHLQRMTTLMRTVLRSEGFNIGLNLGQVAGAGLPGHVHWHLVPRWNGDTNFMPVLGNVKVIPQSLESLYELLRSEIARADG
jgi:ATP adenylyltransferase